MALSLLTGTDALAAGTTWYAYVGGGAQGPLPPSCPQTTVVADQCTLTEALAHAAAGDTVALATPGTAGPYVGNWTIGTPGTSPSSPIIVEAAPSVASPVLDGNLGRPTGCTTASCAGPVLTIGTIAQTGVTYVKNVVYVEVNGLTIEDGDNTTPTQSGIGTGDGSGVNALGGAINNTWGGHLSVVGTQFDNNTANFGGAINNANGDAIGSGTLTVTSCTFTDNEAVDGDGGAINTSGGGEGAQGTTTVTGSTFLGNVATGTAIAHGDGGAIDNGDEYTSDGVLTVAGSTFIDNRATLDGGAIDNGDNGGAGGTSAAPVSVSGSIFVDNSADGTSHSHGDGGAIDNGDLGGHGVMAVSASTFAANSASARGKQSSPWLAANGGAIDNGDHGGHGELTVASSTFDGNSTDAHRGGNSNGGAIDNADDGGNGSLVVSDSTFVTNVAQNGAYGAHGGAIDNADDRSTGTLTVTASTFDINTVYGHDSDDGPLIENHDFGGTGTVYVAADIFNGSCGQGTGHGKWADGGYNIGADGTCGDHGSHDRDYGDSLSGLLGPLAANGGPTPTISLLPAGSQLELAIVPRTTRFCPTTDQRGYATATPGRCDAGSYQISGRATTKLPGGRSTMPPGRR